MSENGVVTMLTANKQSIVKIRAAPLPPDITSCLENNQELIKAIDRDLHLRGSDLAETLEKLSLAEVALVLGEKTEKAMEALKSNLKELFDKEGGEWSSKTVDEIWCFGPRRCGPNLLINRIPGE